MTRKKKATIKDICQLTGLSLGCISKYLNGGNVLEENKIKIEKAIETLGYEVDLFARSMKTGSTKLIAIIIPDLPNAFYAVVASTISKHLQENGYDVVFFEHNEDRKKEAALLKKAKQRRYECVILAPAAKSKEKFKAPDAINLIIIDTIINGLDNDFVIVNNREIVSKATDMLFEKGHRKIAGIFHDEIFTGKERIAGFKESVKRHHAEADCDAFSFNGSMEESYSLFGKVFVSKKYTAIFTSNYTSTLGAIFYINKHNISLPNDVSLLAFDNILLTNLFTPKLTIITQPIEEIGKTVSKVALDIIKNNNHQKQTYVLDCSIEYGQTVSKI